jgi:hypothetical protein
MEAASLFPIYISIIKESQRGGLEKQRKRSQPEVPQSVLRRIIGGRNKDTWRG